MYTESSLPVTGYQDKPVANRFFRQEDETRSLAIVFPGYGYNSDMPLLYYPGQIALDRGMDLFNLETDYNRQPAFSRLSDPEQLTWLDADADAAFDAALAQRSYRQIIVIGKSLGTMAMGHLLERYPRLPALRWVWLTPILNDPRLVAQIQRNHPASLFAIGAKDHYYDETILQQLTKATQGKLIVVPGADHSLEITGTIHSTLLALDQVMTEIEKFMAL